jgi:hypothetical protein
VENALGVFQARIARVFSIAQSSRKLCRCPVVQTAVWPLVVIVQTPTCDFPPGVEQVIEPTCPQALFAQATVKAFYHRVLRGLAGLDVDQLDLAFDTPGQEVQARQLRAIVAANRLGLDAMADDLLQHSCHPLTGEAGVHFQRQALPRISIHYAQHADRTSPSDHSCAKSIAHS